MRGNRTRRDRAPRRPGSIPAHAGEPTRQRHMKPLKRVYPRACGGTGLFRFDSLFQSGLSPRMRGNPQRTWRSWPQSRSIPAHAGEPGAPASSWRISRVYPRACGGTHRPHSDHCLDEGLSPRMRGNPSPAFRSLSGRRSIPAHAGEPRPGRLPRPVGTVYPRACGGTTCVGILLPAPSGLSPRMRGNRDLLRAAQAAAGSIPAHAGEPYRWSPFWARSWVYPRACGGTVALYVNVRVS